MKDTTKTIEEIVGNPNRIMLTKVRGKDVISKKGNPFNVAVLTEHPIHQETPKAYLRSDVVSQTYHELKDRGVSARVIVTDIYAATLNVARTGEVDMIVIPRSTRGVSLEDGWLERTLTFAQWRGRPRLVGHLYRGCDDPGLGSAIQKMIQMYNPPTP